MIQLLVLLLFSKSKIRNTTKVMILEPRTIENTDAIGVLINSIATGL